MSGRQMRRFGVTSCPFRWLGIVCQLRRNPLKLPPLRRADFGGRRGNLGHRSNVLCNPATSSTFTLRA